MIAGLASRRYRQVVASILLIAAAVLTGSVGQRYEAEGAALRSLDIGSAYAPAVRLDPPDVTRSVFVLGDSLMVGVVDSRYITGPSLLQVLAAEGVDAVSAVRIALSIPRAKALLPSLATAISRSDTVVVGLGTSDIFNSNGTTVAAWQRSVTSLIDSIRAINPTARIVWVDVSLERLAGRSVAFNALLDTLDAEDRLGVCPWRSLILAHPEWLANDGLHLRPDGYAGRRNLILSCIGPR